MKNNYRKWLRFVFVCLVIGLVVAIIGPFGTFSELTLVERIVYWQVAITVIGLESLVVILMLFHYPATAHWHYSKVMLASSAIIVLPASMQIHWLNQSLMTSKSETNLIQLSAHVFLILLVILLPMGRRIQNRFIHNVNFASNDKIDSVKALGSHATNEDIKQERKFVNEPDIRQILGIDIQGKLICITAEDHYINVMTDCESQLILRRFSDAVTLLKHYSGLQVHRSWWVASDAIVKLERKSNKCWLVMENNIQVPVSKTYRDSVESYLGNKHAP
ncbi:LytTR family DNA-binding domain-containing protein [Marinomonas sp. 2405UD68-3]|uniref:LytTR family DNA-binding domain-containing protein n=1 Tax=Marinomonas sp. 2405UD68-3 TaxID=3391835 RepID=UPI0039C93461